MFEAFQDWYRSLPLYKKYLDPNGPESKTPFHLLVSDGDLTEKPKTLEAMTPENFGTSWVNPMKVAASVSYVGRLGSKTLKAA